MYVEKFQMLCLLEPTLLQTVEEQKIHTMLNNSAVKQTNKHLKLYCKHFDTRVPEVTFQTLFFSFPLKCNGYYYCNFCVVRLSLLTGTNLLMMCKCAQGYQLLLLFVTYFSQDFFPRVLAFKFSCIFISFLRFQLQNSTLFPRGKKKET